MTPANYSFPSVRRGDTLQAFEIAKLTYDDGGPVGIASARMQARTASNTVVYEWSTANGRINLTGDTEVTNTVTLTETPNVATAQWPVGPLNYDLELTFDSGEVGTVLAGIIPVDADVTR